MGSITDRHKAPFRQLHPGMGDAVARRTTLRKLKDRSGQERWETWGEVAHRVATGNSFLVPEHVDDDDPSHSVKEFLELKDHIAQGRVLMSGRHLQHGDASQPSRNMELFSNCSTAASSFLTFYLLMNGSGVGRCYDDDMMLINWDYAPTVRPVLSSEHPDFDYITDEDVRDAKHKYTGEDVFWFKVPDTREGWAKALEIWENAAFQKIHAGKMLILDFSDVRPSGAPIKGMQGRPASGPKPLMNAFLRAGTLKGAGMPRWRQAMYVDHYFAECVLMAGARRAARMSTKWWQDKDILEFVEIKRPIEFYGMSPDEVVKYRQDNTQSAFLWSSNNSVMVDEQFWQAVREYEEGKRTAKSKKAASIFYAVSGASYGDGTGEPGFINADKLVQNNDGIDKLADSEFAGSKRYQIEDETEVYMKRLAKTARSKKYQMITNPCGEISLHLLGGYCVIADVVPYHANTLPEAEKAIRATVRALIRTNTMDALYDKEVKRTNRIGVSLTGVHEFAWKFFKCGFRDLINAEFDTVEEQEINDTGCLFSSNPRIRAVSFWRTLERFSYVAVEEADRYSKKLGVKAPHTVTTIKPAGTTSKHFGLTEGWHLPSMAWYMRWVQFRHDDPLIEKYRDEGYPVKRLKTYRDVTIVGFPTEPAIASLDMGDKLVMAGEATMQEQYRWVQLGERYWIDPGHGRGNQISYTLKYKPESVSYGAFRDIMLEFQPLIRCCTVMPQADASSYEYQPEQSMTKAEFEEAVKRINDELTEDISREHIDCDGGACPVDFRNDDELLVEAG